jgi:hypothetical protein
MRVSRTAAQTVVHERTLVKRGFGIQREHDTQIGFVKHESDIIIIVLGIGFVTLMNPGALLHVPTTIFRTSVLFSNTRNTSPV